MWFTRDENEHAIRCRERNRKPDRRVYADVAQQRRAEARDAPPDGVRVMLFLVHGEKG